MCRAKERDNDTVPGSVRAVVDQWKAPTAALESEAAANNAFTALQEALPPAAAAAAAGGAAVRQKLCKLASVVTDDALSIDAVRLWAHAHTSLMNQLAFNERSLSELSVEVLYNFPIADLPMRSVGKSAKVYRCGCGHR